MSDLRAKQYADKLIASVLEKKVQQCLCTLCLRYCREDVMKDMPCGKAMLLVCPSCCKELKEDSNEN